MPTKKAYYRKPGDSSRSQPARRVKEARGASHHRLTPVESVVVEDGVWESMKKAEAQALKEGREPGFGTLYLATIRYHSQTMDKFSVRIRERATPSPFSEMITASGSRSCSTVGAGGASPRSIQMVFIPTRCVGRISLSNRLPT
jgi:hypothetical protein